MHCGVPPGTDRQNGAAIADTGMLTSRTAATASLFIHGSPHALGVRIQRRPTGGGNTIPCPRRSSRDNYAFVFNRTTGEGMLSIITLITAGLPLASDRSNAPGNSELVWTSSP